MAKISALTDGSTPVGSTDYYPVARSGANRKISVASHPIVLAKWGVPVILASSGTMGDNGAVSGMTALPTTYSGGAWLYLPANAISAGSAAGFYWFVASSTTAGTVYNSTFNGASVPAAGTTTAFVTTGPGAFTGIATGEITAATVTVPAGAMGPNGKLFFDGAFTFNTAAGNKTPRIKFGATTVAGTTLATTLYYLYQGVIENLGAATAQRGTYTNFSASAISTTSPVTYPAENTGNAVAVLFTLEKATATNHVIWDGATVTLVYGS